MRKNQQQYLNKNYDKNIKIINNKERYKSYIKLKIQKKLILNVYHVAIVFVMHLFYSSTVNFFLSFQ